MYILYKLQTKQESAVDGSPSKTSIVITETKKLIEQESLNACAPPGMEEKDNNKETQGSYTANTLY